MREQRKKLIHYIIPAMLANISMFILTIVDGMFVGNGVGTDALGAVSLAMPFVMFLGAISVLFNIGGVAVAAVRFGRGDNNGANQAFMHSLSVNAATFSVISVICYAASLFASPMYGLAGGLQPLYGLSYGAKDDASLKYYFKSGRRIALFGGLCIFALTFILGRPIGVLFGAEEAAIKIVETALPKYCLNYVFAASSSVIGAYLFSTKRTPYALALNICRSLVFNSVCINVLPRLFGYDFVWFTVAVAEGICLAIAMTLKNISEKTALYTDNSAHKKGMLKK